jgi:hypothetical protein
MKPKPALSLLLLALLAAAPAGSGDIREQVATKYPGLIPREALDRAFDYFNDHADGVANKNYLTIIDFTKPSTARRCHVINLQTGEVESLLVAHARNTGMDRAEHFSNENGSNKSSLGIYLTGELYQGKHGLSMRLDGMEATNNNARRRAIVMHGADYVSPKVVQQQGRLGRSLGCPALEMGVIERIVKELNGKSVMLIYGKEAAGPSTMKSDGGGGGGAAKPGVDE